MKIPLSRVGIGEWVALIGSLLLLLVCVGWWKSVVRRSYSYSMSNVDAFIDLSDASAAYEFDIGSRLTVCGVHIDFPALKANQAKRQTTGSPSSPQMQDFEVLLRVTDHHGVELSDEVRATSNGNWPFLVIKDPNPSDHYYNELWVKIVRPVADPKLSIARLQSFDPRKYRVPEDFLPHVLLVCWISWTMFVASTAWVLAAFSRSKPPPAALQKTENVAPSAPDLKV